MSEKYGLLCFCETWQSPLLWNHYADRHKGICLGFDVRETVLKGLTMLKSEFRYAVG